MIDLRCCISRQSRSHVALPIPRQVMYFSFKTRRNCLPEIFIYVFDVASRCNPSLDAPLCQLRLTSLFQVRLQVRVCRVARSSISFIMNATTPTPEFPPGFLEAYNGHQLRSVAITFLVLTTVSVALRLISRRALQKVALGWDDYLILLGYVTIVGLCVCSFCE